MFVVGATKAEFLKEIRQIIPSHFLLVPGIGAQGGSLSAVCDYGLTRQVGLLVNSSRAILYASNGDDFDVAAANEAKRIQSDMAGELKKRKIT
jgi:orotidine-5'-phosphate decarboxylase